MSLDTSTKTPRQKPPTFEVPPTYDELNALLNIIIGNHSIKLHLMKCAGDDREAFDEFIALKTSLNQSRMNKEGNSRLSPNDTETVRRMLNIMELLRANSFSLSNIFTLARNAVMKLWGLMQSMQKNVRRPVEQE